MLTEAAVAGPPPRAPAWPAPAANTRVPPIEAQRVPTLRFGTTHTAAY